MSKTFSLEEANNSLIFVEPVIKDIRVVWNELQKLRKNLSSSKEVEEIEAKFEKIEHYLDELKQVGCLCRDLDEGIIDFPCFHDGHLIYLCWSPNEDKIKHWHTVEGDYNQRQEIDELFIFRQKLRNEKTHPVSSLAS